MTTIYEKREFQYVILPNTPENADEIALYVDATGYFTGIVLVINTENNTIDETFTTMEEARNRYREVGA